MSSEVVTMKVSASLHFGQLLTASKKKFTSKRQAVLSAFYNTGMKGVGEVYSSRISQAAREAGLKIDQVKVY